jgi:transcriptional regulator with XRE-family HTH domain
MSKLAKLIGPKLKQKRLEFGFTVEFMGEILNCSRQLIEHYENGNCEMPLDRLSEFSKLCDLPVDWFFLDDSSMLVIVAPLNYKRRKKQRQAD